MTFKSALSTVGNGLLVTTTAIANSSTRIELDRVNTQIAELEREKARLERMLVSYR